MYDAIPEVNNDTKTDNNLPLRTALMSMHLTVIDITQHSNTEQFVDFLHSYLPDKHR